MVCRTKLFNQMFITVLIEEHLSKPTQFGKPSKLLVKILVLSKPSMLGQNICHLFSERGGDFDLKLELETIFHTHAKFKVCNSY